MAIRTRIYISVITGVRTVISRLGSIPNRRLTQCGYRILNAEGHIELVTQSLSLYIFVFLHYFHFAILLFLKKNYQYKPTNR